MYKLYFGSPLFTDAQRLFNSKLAGRIRNLGYTVHLPQEDKTINDKSQVVSSINIFTQDTNAIYESHGVIAILDGQDIDSGLSAELGIAYENMIPIYALYTDIRHQTTPLIELDEGETPHHYINQYVIGLIKHQSNILQKGGLYTSVEDLLEALRGDYGAR